ncbi:MAG: DUF5703 domain-containing protein [Anaerolineae bacterium]|nr:DUF5703 domain-containing protein [Thermoflexales bacterium]MDW8406542.1 DUF5703 domain-containing protein [Anaerolineae bacterium]
MRWTTPSRDSSGSMPLGNGDIGLNVWVEPNGDLLFYIAKSDAWSEVGRLLKIGRVRIRCEAQHIESFHQTLVLENGEIAIRLNEIDLRVWVDAHHPAVYVEAEAEHPFVIEAGVELWRNAAREIYGDELFSAYDLHDAPYPVIESADRVLSEPSVGGVMWCHHNSHSMWRDAMMLQGMDSLISQFSDPLLHRTFGAWLTGEGFTSPDAYTLRSSAPRRRHLLTVHVLTTHTSDVNAWARQLIAQAAHTDTIDLGERRAAHQGWWRDFWQRSWIVASGDQDAETVTRGYVLQRFISACAGRGAYPIKFNGSLFTVDADEHWNGKQYRYNADFRAWGGPYWFQNTRLAYWPMLAAGDFDLMQPLFKMYMQALPLLQARTRLYFGHAGAFFPETMNFWGGYANPNYGWERAGKPAHLIDNTYIRHYYSCGLELLTLMLDYAAFTEDEAFIRSTLLPWAENILTFYDQHYPRDAGGKLHMAPAQALETWQQVINPAPDIAGLRYTLNRLADYRHRSAVLDGACDRLRAAVPDLPMRDENGARLLGFAEQVLEEAKNMENVELYAVFPFRLFGVGKPSLDLARATFDRRHYRHNRGWCQDSIQAACLGLEKAARQMVAARFAVKHAGSRFPAFWGPNFDWIPDQDHGTAGMMTLQLMLMQTEANHIFLAPAWPREWDVVFRLRAPMNTVVEGTFAQGRLQALTVTPESRRAAMILPA